MLCKLVDGQGKLLELFWAMHFILKPPPYCVSDDALHAVKMLHSMALNEAIALHCSHLAMVKLRVSVQDVGNVER